MRMQQAERLRDLWRQILDLLPEVHGNYAVVEGTLANSPHLSYGGGVTPLCRLEVVNGDETVVVLATAKLAERCSALSKGQRIRAWGKLLVKQWKVGDGGRRVEPQVHLREIEVL